MKRLALLAVVLSVSVAACTKDDDSAPTAPSTVLAFVSQMSGTQEVPTAAGPEAGAVGSAQVSMTPTGAGSYSATFAFQVGGLVRAGVLPAPLDSGSVIVAGHIHSGAAGVAGPPVVALPISVAAPLVSPTGSILIQFTNVAVPEAVANAIKANPAGFYLNLHSALNPAGVVRGQLILQ